MHAESSGEGQVLSCGSRSSCIQILLDPSTSGVHDKITEKLRVNGSAKKFWTSKKKALEYREAAATESPGDDKEAEPVLEGKEDTFFS